MLTKKQKTFNWILAVISAGTFHILPVSGNLDACELF